MQYSRRSCLVMSGIDVATGNETEEQTEVKVQQRISKKLNISQEDFDYELDKLHRLLTKASDKNKKNHQQSSANFGLISLENIFS